MKTLRFKFDEINKNYSQEIVNLREYDYHNKTFILKPNPKFLFRGEMIFLNTKSRFHRLAFSSSEKEMLKNYVLDLSAEIFHRFFGSIIIGSEKYKSKLIQIGAFLQHYGFPLMWLDFTDKMEVAAFFATYQNDMGMGRIWIVKTSSLIDNNEMIFKLDGSFARRPTLQNAYALRMFDDKPDFQNSNHFKSVYYDFIASKEDIDFFEDKSLLNTEFDKISDFIIDYCNSRIIKNKNLKEYLMNIKSDLIKMRTFH